MKKAAIVLVVILGLLSLSCRSSKGCGCPYGYAQAVTH